MKKKIARTLMVALAVPPMLQVGCISAADVQTLAEAQLILFFNALINSVTTDFITGALGG